MPRPAADVLIVTVTPTESKAVLHAFAQATGGNAKTLTVDDRVYRDLGEINGTRVFMALSEMGATGLGAAQQAVQKGIAALQPHAVIMVGIAFGINEEKQSIGDILVSRQLMLYESQRIGAGKIIPRGDRPHAATRLLNYLQSADLDWDGAEVRFGLVLTGEKLVDDLDYRESLKAIEQEAIGGEMEGAGLYVACQDAKVDWILVKAICDWADGNKGQDKKARQQQAAENAAAFVLFALRHAPLGRPQSRSGLPTPTGTFAGRTDSQNPSDGFANQATLTGNGAIAQGPGAKAVGAGGVLVDGNNSGNINTGTYVHSDVNISGGDFVGRDKLSVYLQANAARQIPAHPASKPSPALRVWQEKLEFLLVEQAVNADPMRGFQLEKAIEEARQKIKALGGLGYGC